MECFVYLGWSLLAAFSDQFPTHDVCCHRLGCREKSFPHIWPIHTSEVDDGATLTVTAVAIGNHTNVVHGRDLQRAQNFPTPLGERRRERRVARVEMRRIFRGLVLGWMGQCG